MFSENGRRLVASQQGKTRSRVLARLTAAAALALAIPQSAAWSAPAQIVQIDPTRLAGLPDFIDGVMAQQIATRDVAGAVVTVVYRGKVLFTRGYGYADTDRRIPVDPLRTLFRPGSVSKLFTWAALMQQVEAGRVDLDAEVNRYLDYKIPDKGLKPIKVRDLMSHIAGFGDQADITADKVEDLVPYRTWMKDHIAMRVREPGIESQYSNYGAALAGYIVEMVSGEPYADYAEKNIFAPLGMTDTTFREPLAGSQAERMAQGYKLVDGRLVAKPFELFSKIMPAGSASATAPDMARFIQAMLNDGTLGQAQILKPASIKLLESDGFKNAPHLPGFGNGFMVLRETGPRMVEHGGNTIDQHSFLLLAPEAQFGFFVSETGGPGSYPGRTELVQAIVGRLFPVKPAPRWTGAETPAPLGAYRTNRQDYSKPADPRGDLKVTAAGPHGLVTEQAGQKLYWQQIGLNLFEQATGARDGGPYEQLEFYGPAGDPRLSFSSQPHVLYRLVKP
jgi:CubicO group peptidase (beta-lactamase class C family)